MDTQTNKQQPRKLGIVFQDFKLLPDRNVNNNLRFVLKATGWTDDSKMDSKIEEVLTKVGMKTKGFKFPHELSGGEQQRIAIARALLNDPELILADEPTGNLDSHTGTDILNLLAALNADGRTIILVTHDARVAARARQVLHMQDGQIINTEL